MPKIIRIVVLLLYIVFRSHKNIFQKSSRKQFPVGPAVIFDWDVSMCDAPWTGPEDPQNNFHWYCNTRVKDIHQYCDERNSIKP